MTHRNFELCNSKVLVKENRDTGVCEFKTATLAA